MRNPIVYAAFFTLAAVLALTVANLVNACFEVKRPVTELVNLSALGVGCALAALLIPERFRPPVARRPTPPTRSDAPHLGRSAPPQGSTNIDLVLGTVLGFLSAIVLGAAATLVFRSPAAMLFLVPFGVIAGVGVVRARIRARWRQYHDQRSASLKESHCPACDYDLRGTVEPRCPECGEPFTPDEWSARTDGPPAELHDQV